MCVLTFCSLFVVYNTVVPSNNLVTLSPNNYIHMQLSPSISSPGAASCVVYGTFSANAPVSLYLANGSLPISASAYPLYALASAGTSSGYAASVTYGVTMTAVTDLFAVVRPNGQTLQATFTYTRTMSLFSFFFFVCVVCFFCLHIACFNSGNFIIILSVFVSLQLCLCLSVQQHCALVSLILPPPPLALSTAA